MDYDIEWLLEKIYLIKQDHPNRELRFLSDWDCFTHSDNQFSALISKVFEDAKLNSYKYHYSYDQFELKKSIVNSLLQQQSLSINTETLTFTPSATISINLSLTALQKSGIKRYLLFMPAYFSVLKSFENINAHIVYFHLSDKNSFQIDLDLFEKTVKEQFIECTILTDPIYSTGVDIPVSVYNSIVEICNRNKCSLLVDYSLGGLSWDHGSLEVLPATKLAAVTKCKYYCFIDAFPKRLFINGIKCSIIFGSSELVDSIDRLSEGIYGAMNVIQLELLKKILSPGHAKVIIARMKDSVENIAENFAIIKNVLPKEFELSPSESGAFTYLVYKEQRLQNFDTRRFAEFILDNYGIIILTNDRLGFIDQNQLAVRINLTNPHQLLTSSVLQCCRLPLHAFNY